MMSAPIVFFDLAGPDSKALRGFYSSLFGWAPESAGPFFVNVEAPLMGAFRQDPAEKRLYIGVTDVTTKLQEIEANGGSIDVPRFEVPGVVILGLFRDPAGNPMGLVELEGGKPKIP
jgi:predicted enzyme related to lactoylglutathione lyase